MLAHKGRYFCLSFGHGHLLIEPLAIERNFGLKVALNQGNQISIRSIDKTSIDMIEVKGREQSSKDAEIANFGFDIELDILKAITAKDEDGKTTLSGRDAISVSAHVQIDRVRELIDNYLDIYSRQDYKKKFSWVDNIAEERDKSIVETLNVLLVNSVNQRNISNIWMSIPEIIDWEHTSGFAYRRNKNPTVRPDIHLESWLSEIVDGSLIDLNFLRRRVIFHYDVNSILLNKWSVYRCLNAEIDCSGRKYILNDGSWYLVEVNFVTEVNTAFERIPDSSVILPKSEFLKEPDYNQKVVRESSGSMCLMDRKNIQYGGGRSSVEFCDIFDDSNRIIHVKKYGGSSVLSHLFQQGVVSGEAFLSDRVFREKVNEELGDEFKLPDPKEAPNASNYEVCFAIMSDQPGDLYLPFFSKVVLKNADKRLRTYGYRVTKKKIEFL